MQKVLPVLACLFVGASAQFPTQCVVDCGMGAYSLYKAGTAINGAITACGSNSTAGLCIVDIGTIITNLATASGYISEAVGSCGGPESACAVNVSFAVATVGRAVSTTGTATDICSKGASLQCAAATAQAGVAVARAQSDMENAVASCSDDKLPEPATECGKNLAVLRRDLSAAFYVNTVTADVAQHISAVAAACGTCFDSSFVSSAVFYKQWNNALTTVVSAGASC